MKKSLPISFAIKKLCTVVTICLLVATSTYAQDAKHIERPTDVKVVREYQDENGNMVRELQYKQGRMVVSETVFLPKPKRVVVAPPEEVEKIKREKVNKDSLIVLIDKTQYSLTVFYKKKCIKSYRAVFGPNPRMNKRMEGDRNTPEGWFTITRLNPKSRYNKFMEISYPDATHRERFQKLKESGVIPKTARIGGNIGIHGIWEGGDDMIELGVGWTDGCIALRNADMNELYQLIGIGTRVFIKK